MKTRLSLTSNQMFIHMETTETQTQESAVTDAPTNAVPVSPVRNPGAPEKRVNWKLISLGLAILAILIGGFLWARKSEKSGSDDARKAVYVPADWKTYSNGTYGFSVRYPKEWTVRDDAQTCISPDAVDKESVPSGSTLCTIDFFSFVPGDSDEAFDPEKWPKDGFVVSLNLGYNPAKLSSEEYIAQDEESLLDEEDEDSSIDTGKKKEFMMGRNAFTGFENDSEPYYFGPYYMAKQSGDQGIVVSAVASFGLEDEAEMVEEQAQERTGLMNAILSSLRFE